MIRISGITVIAATIFYFDTLPISETREIRLSILSLKLFDPSEILSEICSIAPLNAIAMFWTKASFVGTLFLMDALVISAGITWEAANNIEFLWADLGLEAPTYLQPIKESSHTLILFVKTDSINQYYITLEKSDSSIVKITADAEAGEIIYCN